jgi:hypothetical protein
MLGVGGPLPTVMPFRRLERTEMACVHADGVRFCPFGPLVAHRVGVSTVCVSRHGLHGTVFDHYPAGVADYL